jgi:uncharacterized protein (TIGR02271 family)
MTRIAVALYDNASAAYAIVEALIEDGIGEHEISVVMSEAAAPAGSHAKTSGPLGTGRADLHGLADDLARLGVPREEAEYYAEGVRRGGSVVVVQAAEDVTERAAAIMERRAVVDYENRTSQWRETGWTGYDADAPPYTVEEAERERAAYRGTGTEEVVPIVEEQVDVGKRAVERGRVRVHTRVVQRPVEQTVGLRDEEVHVERRSANRPVTASEDAFKERTIEAVETDEEAVVEKEARVIEEVVVSKDAVEREETVRDTVRRTEVDVEDTTTAGRRGRTEGP